MAETKKDQATPLDDVMLAMDVVDTLRHRADLVDRELNEGERAKDLIEKLKKIYADQGIDVPDHILAKGVKEIAESRFVYDPPPKNLKTLFARAYVSRHGWGKWVIAAISAIIIVLVGYYAAYRPIVGAQIAEQTELLTKTLPNRIARLEEGIIANATTPLALARAETIRENFKAAADAKNIESATQFTQEMEALNTQIRQTYQVRVVNRAGECTGIWRNPPDGATSLNYYLIVEAINDQNQALTMPILNQETQIQESVSMWALHVPNSVFESVRADKIDDGIIQNNILGTKNFGELDVAFDVPVVGGTITQWKGDFEC